MAKKRTSKPKKKPKIVGKSAQKKRAPSNARLPLLLGILLFGLAFLIYANTLSHDYAFDDFSVIKQNFVTQQGMDGLSTIFSEHYRYGYGFGNGTLFRPLSLATFALEWEIAPDQAWLHHLINVLLYAILCPLLFFVSFQMMGKNGLLLSFFAVLLFTVHPIHTEVVANIKSRDELLSALGGFAALWGLFKYVDKQKISYLLLALFAYLAAMYSKESSITFLAVFPLALYFFRSDYFSKKWWITLSFLIPVIFFMFHRYTVLGTFGGIKGGISVLDNALIKAPDPLSQLSTAIYILGIYLQKLFIPYPLVSDMGFAQIPYMGLSNWQVWISLLVYAGLGGFALYLAPKRKTVSFWLLFFFITLSIYANIVILIGSSYGERFLFIPSLGIMFGVAWLILYLLKTPDIARFKTPGDLWKYSRSSLLITGMIAVIFAIITIDRNNDWENSFSIYSADILKAPNCAKLRYHYGLELSKLGLKQQSDAERRQFQENAIEQFVGAIAIHPSYSDAYGQMGLSYYRIGNNQKALENYEKAISFNENNPTVYSNMGIIYFNNQNYPKAREVYEKAVKLKPSFVDARRNLGSVYAMSKRFDDALQQFREALRYATEKDDIATLNYYIGMALRDKGEIEKSVPYFNKANRLNPSLKKN